MRVAPFFFGLLFLAAGFRAPGDSPSGPHAADVAAYDSILAHVDQGQTMVTLGDMMVPVATVQLWRDQLAGTAQPSASQTGINNWTGGIVYYTFDASVIENATVKHRTATLDAMAEWAAFANLTFTPRVAQANYMLIKEDPARTGGISAVGMIGGPQQFDIGPTSWNRGTLVHEIGHTLGLIHEHQRSDRDTYVSINFSNVPGGLTDGNFILVPTSTNNGAYDFLSVMHYARKTLAVNTALDTITPKAGYTQFGDIMGNNPDRVLSRAARDGMAAMYGVPAVAPTIIVTNTKDSGAGALRTAIYKVFDLVTDTPGATPVITFQIPNTDPNFAGGVFTIAPTDRLTAPGTGTKIDATTQTTFTGNTNASGPEVVLNGANQTDPSTYGLGLRLSTTNVTVKGLVINGFNTRGILITGAAATGNTVAGCYIGTNAAGTAVVANTFVGIEISGGATGNTIGGTATGAGNLISGNTSQGIYIGNTGTNSNVVAGNWIGLNGAGTGSVPNGYAGIEIGGGAQSNSIGGTSAAARNVISGNQNQGVSLNGAGTSSNSVMGNYIGTNPAGTAAIANGYPGVEIFSSASANTIGGTAPGAGNVISGNTSRGATIAGANNNVFAGNLIGLNAAGTAALANLGAGIQIFGGAQANTIGSTSGGRNFIAGNNGASLTISGSPTNGNIIVGNSIGVTPSGSVVTNTNEGIALFADGSGGAQNNVIGGTAPGAANLISGNGAAGIAIYNAGTTGNRITGNSITGNGGLGIDIWGDGVTLNDAGDGDTGPNNLQNFPVLTSAVLGIGTTVSGSLNSTASATVRIEFFASATGDASGYGEGQTFVGAISVTTNVSGNVSFATTLPTTVPAGQKITATATDPAGNPYPAGNTSEFAQNVTVTTTDTDSDGIPDAWMNAKFGHPTGLAGDKSRPGDDADGDGMTNLQEFRAGTDPKIPASIFRLPAPTRVGSDLSVGLPTLVGYTYRVEFTDTLSPSASWRPLADQIFGTGGTLNITDPGAASLAQRFYRAVILP